MSGLLKSDGRLVEIFDSDEEARFLGGTGECPVESAANAIDTDGTDDYVSYLQRWMATPHIFVATFKVGETTNMVVHTVFGTKIDPGTTPEESQEFTKSLIASVSEAYVNNPASWLDGPRRMKKEFREAARRTRLPTVFGDKHPWSECEVSVVFALPRDVVAAARDGGSSGAIPGFTIGQADDTTEEECKLAIQYHMNIREDQKREQSEESIDA